MMALMVWSQVHVESTPAFLSRWLNAFSASSCVANPLCGITGSSGMLGRGGKAPVAAIGRLGAEPPKVPPGVPPSGRPIVPSVPFNPSVGFGGSCVPAVKLGAMSRLEIIEYKELLDRRSAWNTNTYLGVG